MYKRWPIVLIVFLSTLIVTIWFRSQRLIAVGEEALWMYNPGITLRHYYSYWNEIGLGTSDAFFLPRVTHILPLYLATQLMTNWQAQAVSFWVLLVLGSGGCYIMLRRLLPEDRLIPTVAALFYVFNLYSVSQVWGRYISAGIFTWAFLPIFLWNWMEWLRTGSKRLFSLFLVLNLIFANAFGSPVFIFTFWIPAGLYSLFVLRTPKTLARSLIGMLGWVTMHIVWLYPFLATSATSFSRFSGFDYNFNSILSVSQYFGVDQLLVLRQGFLFDQTNFLSGFYNLPLVQIASLIILIMVFVGLIKKTKIVEHKYFIWLFLVGIIICKGTQPPFGFGIFYTAFKYFSPSMLLRNPYEKYGPAYLLAYTGVLALGLYAIRRHKLLVIAVVVAILLIGTPVWTGSIHQGRQVEVPNYYAQTNTFLNQDAQDFRVLILPIIPGEAARYVWPKGTFEGAEPSEFLFDKNVISRTDFNTLNFQKYFELHDTVTHGSDPTNLFDQLAIRYLVLHHDQDFAFSTASSSAQVETTLARIPHVSFVQKFGGLSIYEYKNFKPMIELVSPVPVNYLWHKVSPTRYTLQVRENLQPFKIFLKQAYHPKWVAKIDDDSPIDHFVAYGYANGWQVEKLGSYDIELQFQVWPWQ